MCFQKYWVYIHQQKYPGRIAIGPIVHLALHALTGWKGHSDRHNYSYNSQYSNITNIYVLSATTNTQLIYITQY